MVLCGSKKVAWHHLSSVLFLICQLILEGDITSDNAIYCLSVGDCLNIMGRVDCIRQPEGTSKPDAIYILETTFDMETYEPVDRVYAILGMLPPVCRELLVVDYSVENITQYWRVYIALA
jgi:hypothetical protein